VNHQDDAQHSRARISGNVDSRQKFLNNLSETLRGFHAVSFSSLSD
jgi:hypothetical protein